MPPWTTGARPNELRHSDVKTGPEIGRAAYFAARSSFHSVQLGLAKPEPVYE